METLAIAKTLQKIDGIEHDEAYNIAEAINGRSGLATREDLSEVKAELKEDLSGVKAELKEDISGVKAEIAEVKAEITEVKSDVVWIKWILGVSISLMIAGMLFLYTRMDRLDQKIDSIKDLIIQEMKK